MKSAVAFSESSICWNHWWRWICLLMIVICIRRNWSRWSQFVVIKSFYIFGITASCFAGCCFTGCCFDGNEIQVKAYCPCNICTDGNGITATRSSAYQCGIAVPKPDKNKYQPIPYGSQITVPGYGTTKADDTGSQINKKWFKSRELTIEVRFQDHDEALRWGKQRLPITWTVFNSDESTNQDSKRDCPSTGSMPR